LDAHNVTVLPEIHEHYTIQLKIAEHDYYVYDFALPMLVLHTLFSGRVDRLVHWMEICPRKQFTTLDTHDGIGVVDVKDLMSDEEIEAAREALYAQGANVKKKYSSAEYNNLDIYQINCTYYSALGNNDQAYLLARVLQCFAPGIPQIYYVGLLAGENDIELLEHTKEGRNINRHYYTLAEIEREVQRDVVQQLFNLLKFRNTSRAFDGEFSVKALDANEMEITWHNAAERTSAVMRADTQAKTFSIVETVDGVSREILL
jgi:sucrose phosphorylase